ncbi:flagellar basal body P-ring formation chaperone FlgA [Massilia sp. CCM 9210]|uniref:flagellar basal body P-ring formation chaperone FlgA n=1 Tax=Massilia scottii TaxID=3057166 RepID=UPI002796657C|nr:flagellar basal body P-ring formation chaperone FlgA [Massilia sp. CCM 9210]MDQ1816164.1 flagellar basal body P-ring formation chaperone FlgA [Massilia sp. CCM 9210]
MSEVRRATSALLLPLTAAALISLAGGNTNAADISITARLEQAAHEQLARQADTAGLAEPQFTVNVATPRAAPPCAKPVNIEAVDTRTPARMRFAVLCPDAGGWKYEYVLRASVSALVAVTAAPVAAGQMLTAQDVTLERRDVTTLSDAIGSAEAATGQASRRSLRAGEVLRQAQLSAPLLVKRGEPVVMLARFEAIEISTSGEALDAGALHALVRVRNLANGRVVRMRVIAAGTVEPVEMPRPAQP